jgi:hypothetical protein
MDDPIPPASPESSPLGLNTPPQGPSDTKERLPKKPYYFSKETMQSLQELGDALRVIHKRLVSEGFTISNGKISKKSNPRVHNGANGNNRESNTEKYVSR